MLVQLWHVVFWHSSTNTDMSRLRGLAASMTAARRAAVTLLHPAPLPAVLCSAARHYSTPPLTSESVHCALLTCLCQNVLALESRADGPSNLSEEVVRVCVCVAGWCADVLAGVLEEFV